MVFLQSYLSDTAISIISVSTQAATEKVQLSFYVENEPIII